MATVKLTRDGLKAILKAAPPAKPTIYFDEAVTGFGVRVFPTGAASFVLEYRPRDGGRDAAKKRIKIGAVGEMTLEAAREAAKDMKSDIRRAKIGEGADPMEERQAARRAETLEELVQAYLDRHVKVKRKASTLDLYQNYLRTHIAPRQDKKDPESPYLPGSVGGRKAIAVTHEILSAFHEEVGKEHPRTANACVTLIASAYTWGAPKKVAGLTPTSPNPAKGIERFEEKGRERIFTDDEWERLADTLALAETDGLPRDEPKPGPKSKHAPKKNLMVDKHAVACIRLLMTTGCRLREILNLEWAHVDFENARLNLPDSKTGKKHVGLSDYALEILQGLQPTNYRFVVAGETAGQEDESPRADLHRPWARIIKHAGLGALGVKGAEGYRAPLRIHDIRHAYASNAIASGLDIFTVGKLLGHKDIRTTQKYLHLHTDALRAAANTNSASIKAKMAGKRRNVA
ncbi:MAG TPA: site-specific integrase [Caulobacterales bacterium]|nr:site-specific integrase [Caulobacterales bacterium]